MNRSNVSLIVLGLGVVLGVFGDLFLGDAPWGFGFPIWTSLLIVAMAISARLAQKKIDAGSWAMLGSAWLFSLFFALRDSSELKIANGVAIIVAVGVFLLRRDTGKVWIASISDYTTRIFESWVCTLGAFVELLAKDITWSKYFEGARAKRSRAVFRGLAIAAPILLVFGGLFVSADRIFGDMVGRMFRLEIDFVTFMSHATIICSFAIVSAGVLAYALQTTPPPAAVAQGETRRLGLTESAIVFGSLNLLFLFFVIVQFQYLFGGDSRVQLTEGLTYAEYARSGFMELVTVALLSLPLLLIGYHYTEHGKEGRVFKWMTTVFVTLLFVIMASALERMRLYVDAYGLTSLRLYTSAFMVWLAAVFFWMLPTLLRNKHERFAFGGVVAGLAVVLALNLANPDALMARVNITRKHLDVKYLGRLSADALPVIRAASKRTTDVRLREAEAAIIARSLDRPWNSHNVASLDAAGSVPEVAAH